LRASLLSNLRAFRERLAFNFTLFWGACFVLKIFKSIFVLKFLGCFLNLRTVAQAKFDLIFFGFWRRFVYLRAKPAPLRR